MKAITSSILRHIESLGYAVSVHRIPSSLLGTVGAFVETHAVKLAAPNDQHIAKVDGMTKPLIAPPAFWRRWWGLSWRMDDRREFTLL